MEIIEQIDAERWDGPFPGEIAAALESGKVLFAPRLHFELTEAERRFLSPDYLDGKSKNISYRPETGALGRERNRRARSGRSCSRCCADIMSDRSRC